VTKRLSIRERTSERIRRCVELCNPLNDKDKNFRWETEHPGVIPFGVWY